ncbi:Nuclear_transport factor 2 [Hexamita inflata]|uniref:Nuclear transport factor 2 n=1 Tax=Hexamita inflata TaxID=28002 RepID=A0AA86NAR5_9EUKA|nr:Nuclear transport factor 2 [Hexamita inflata]CAI9940874.1 Nuclear transport factor 2 [Hexamita inflata]
MNFDTLAQQFTQFYYSVFSVRQQRVTLINNYMPQCNAVYNGRLYKDHAGLNQLFSARFALGDLQINPTSICACPAGDAVMINVLGNLVEQTGLRAIFSQSFLLVGDGAGNFSIMSDIFAIEMLPEVQQQQMQ